MIRITKSEKKSHQLNFQKISSNLSEDRLTEFYRNTLFQSGFLPQAICKQVEAKCELSLLYFNGALNNQRSYLI